MSRIKCHQNNATNNRKRFYSSPNFCHLNWRLSSLSIWWPSQLLTTRKFISYSVYVVSVTFEPRIVQSKILLVSSSIRHVVALLFIFRFVTPDSVLMPLFLTPTCRWAVETYHKMLLLSCASVLKPVCLFLFSFSLLICWGQHNHHHLLRADNDHDDDDGVNAGQGLEAVV